MTGKLVTDSFVRRCAQIILLGGLSLLALLQTIFLIILLLRIVTVVVEVPIIQNTIIALLRFPFATEFSGLSAIIAGVVPVVFSVVCFKVNDAVSPPAVTDDLNDCGRAAILLLFVGALVGVLAVIVAGLNTGLVEQMVGSADGRVAVRNTLSAILAFDFLYCTQLIGLKK